MNIITILTETDKEMKSAGDYGKLYQHHKKSNPVLAKRFYEISADKMKHASFLHDMAVDKIRMMEERDQSFSEFLEDMWEEKDSEYVENLAMLKAILNM